MWVLQGNGGFSLQLSRLLVKYKVPIDSNRIKEEIEWISCQSEAAPRHAEQKKNPPFTLREVDSKAGKPLDLDILDKGRFLVLEVGVGILGDGRQEELVVGDDQIKWNRIAKGT
jgi:hypothetical protein